MSVHGNGRLCGRLGTSLLLGQSHIAPSSFGGATDGSSNVSDIYCRIATSVIFTAEFTTGDVGQSNLSMLGKSR